MTELTTTRLRELYLPPTDDFTFVDVPELQYAMIDGEGEPGGDVHRHAIKWLFSAIYPIKRVAKERMGRHFVEPPLEGLWWADDVTDLMEGRRDRLKWRMMIVTADWVTDSMFADAVAEASDRMGEVPDGLRLERFTEGRCVQILHVGDYPAEAESLARRLHDEFLPVHGLMPNGHHHEIYLNDPERVAPEKLRTVVRQPVRDASAAA
jgi:hypothetical protein